MILDMIYDNYQNVDDRYWYLKKTHMLVIVYEERYLKLLVVPRGNLTTSQENSNNPVQHPISHCDTTHITGQA